MFAWVRFYVCVCGVFVSLRVCVCVCVGVCVCLPLHWVSIFFRQLGDEKEMDYILLSGGFNILLFSHKDGLQSSFSSLFGSQSSK